MDIEELAKITERAAGLEKRCKELESKYRSMERRLQEANQELKKTQERLSRALKKRRGDILNVDDEHLLFKARATLVFNKHIGGGRALNVRGPYLRASYSANGEEKGSLFSKAMKDLRTRGWK